MMIAEGQIDMLSRYRIGVCGVHRLSRAAGPGYRDGVPGVGGVGAVDGLNLSKRDRAVPSSKNGRDVEWKQARC
jgi:hypothetical protein